MFVLVLLGYSFSCSAYFYNFYLEYIIYLMFLYYFLAGVVRNVIRIDPLSLLNKNVFIK